MAYFAEIDDDGNVLQVISVSNADAPDPAPEHSEPLGQAFIAGVLGLTGTWVQTSWSGSIRKQYAGVSAGVTRLPLTCSLRRSLFLRGALTLITTGSRRRRGPPKETGTGTRTRSPGLRRP